VGQRIVNRLQEELNGILALKVKITKICPPINGDVDSVAISIEI
jgi:dihydroneopterin aldolase